MEGSKKEALAKLAATTKERRATRDLEMKKSSLKFRLQNKNKNFTPTKTVEDETQMNWQDKIYESLTEGRRAHRGHRDVAGKKLSRPTPKKRTPEEAAAAAAKGQAAHDKRVAARKAHMKVQNKKNAEERAKRKAGQTLDPRTNKPK